jgi:AcrR family transcriptional regulator
MPASKASARQQARKSTRDVILDVAERRFARHGFAGVAVRDIATDAGLKNQASLYNHFRNKRALYEAVLARGVEPLIAILAEGGKGQAADRTGVAGVLDERLDRVIEYLVEHPHLPRLIQRAGLDDSRYLRNAFIKLLRPLYDQGVNMLAQTGGPWQNDQLPHLAAGLYLLIFGYFANAPLLETVLPEDPRSASAVARQRRFLRTAVALLLGAEPPSGQV